MQEILTYQASTKNRRNSGLLRRSATLHFSQGRISHSKIRNE